MSAMNKSEARAARGAQRAMYAPRPRPIAVVRERESEVDVQLRKLTAKVLEDLKFPGAIPSQVIAGALRQARAL
jgi:hypothetical protein